MMDIKKTGFKAIGIFLLSSFSAFVSYLLSLKLLSDYSLKGSDLINVIFLTSSFNNYDYLQFENIFIYFPTLIFFIVGYISICISGENNIKDSSSFVCARASNLRHLKGLYTRHNDILIFFYVTVFWGICILLCDERISFFYCACAVERVLVLIILKNVNYTINRKNDIVHAMLYSFLIIVFCIMIDSMLAGKSIISVPDTVKQSEYTMIVEIIICLFTHFLSVYRLGKNEVL